MEDHHSPSSSLPPGCRFFPSDEQLLRCYLSNRAAAAISPNGASSSAACNLIKDLDPLDYDPFDLPDSACFSYGSRGRKKHWYYYSVTALMENRGGWVRMKSGYWKRKGKVREVIGNRGIVLGIKRSFVFYLGNSIKNAVKTNWIMYEYALADRLKASIVLHRVFLSGGGVRISRNGFSSYGEGSVSAVCNIGNNQHGRVDCEACGGDILNTGNGQNHQVTTNPVSAAATLHVPSQTHPCDMTPPSMSTHVIDKQQLISILEGDFLELDDLVD